jgi:large subunit ribosomal protein L54
VSPVQRSICVEGTVLTGLNYTKGGSDPVAMKDEDYPEWLWKCLEVTQKSSDASEDGAADEFCTFMFHPPTERDCGHTVRNEC